MIVHGRYRYIWPFEHARVRLRKTRPEDDDYMNASYVQPLCTTKRYIATQGPLPTTLLISGRECSSVRARFVIFSVRVLTWCLL